MVYIHEISIQYNKEQKEYRKTWKQKIKRVVDKLINIVRKETHYYLTECNTQSGVFTTNEAQVKAVF